MDRAYNHLGVEERLYESWVASGAFSPDVPEGGREEVAPFCIVIPPPNVTGVLHHGSAMFVTLQDVMIRWRRMQGYRTLWLPGTDHAGIATQNVVESALAREGLTRFDLGREKFVERVWQWKEEYGSRIVGQLKRLGASCDWTRERFTLDAGLSRAVREAFVRLYERELIYRGSYIINWCPRCTTVLSDVEVEHVEQNGKLWFVRYPLQGDPDRFVTVATTRPETILGDTGVAVHPDDSRYSDVIGGLLVLPLVDRLIPVVGDAAVDVSFGTGAVKVTPAHDLTDYEIGARAKLPSINILNPDGTVNENGGIYAGLDRFAARDRVVADLEVGGFLVKVEDHVHSVTQCSRCDTVLEPRISEQWFVRMKPLAEPAIAAVRDGRTRIIPERFQNAYFQWMENIRDWVISRQLWWGHRIPVWYCDACDTKLVPREDPIACPDCGGPLRQDEDVLDTWFSSALWPFSTLGWPDDTPDLRYFYPTSVLETGYDILPHWVSRMMMTGLAFMGEVPFRDIYLHGLVRHTDGTKISKSNYRPGDDPLEVIESYGADALRFTLVTGSTPGNDLRISLDRIEGGRNFANKLWNAARFVISSAQQGVVRTSDQISIEQLDASDRWILSRMNAVTADVERSLEQFSFGEAGRLLYEFVWNEFCDWYIEMAKLGLRSGDSERQKAVQSTLFAVLERSLLLLHPMIPYVTEEIWAHLPATIRDGRELLMTAKWPTAGVIDSDAERDMNLVMEVVRQIRNVRSEYKVEAHRKIDAIIVAGSAIELFVSQNAVIRQLAGLDKVRIESRLPEPPSRSLALIASAVEIYIPLAGMIDIETEMKRIRSEIEQARGQADRLDKLFANEAFVRRARPDVIERERTRQQENIERLATLEQQLLALG